MARLLLIAYSLLMHNQYAGIGYRSQNGLIDVHMTSKTSALSEIGLIISNRNKFIHQTLARSNNLGCFSFSNRNFQFIISAIPFEFHPMKLIPGDPYLFVGIGL